MANVIFNDTNIKINVKNPGLYIHEENNTANPNPFIAQFNRENLSSSYSDTSKHNTISLSYSSLFFSLTLTNLDVIIEIAIIHSNKDPRII